MVRKHKLHIKSDGEENEEDPDTAAAPDQETSAAAGALSPWKRKKGFKVCIVYNVRDDDRWCVDRLRLLCKRPLL